MIKNIIIEKIDKNGNVLIEEDCVVREERITFFLNGKKLLSVMSLPKDQDAHIVGFLMSEAVIDNVDDISSLKISDDGLTVYAEATINEANMCNLFKEKTLTTGCCVGITGNIDNKILKEFNKTTHKYFYKRLFESIESFYEESELFNKTGCVHKTKLVFEDGNFIESEDVGRHNSIDKTVGKAKLARIDIQKSFLIVSGRLSMEMVIKCVMHKIPLIISKAAPTHLGIKTAQLHGITLIGFARNGKMNVYTHSSRIQVDTIENDDSHTNKDINEI